MFLRTNKYNSFDSKNEVLGQLLHYIIFNLSNSKFVILKRYSCPNVFTDNNIGAQNILIQTHLI